MMAPRARKATVVELDTRSLLTTFRGVCESCAMCGKQAVIRFDADTADALGRDALDRALAALGWITTGPVRLGVSPKRYCHVVCYWAATESEQPTNLNLSSAMLGRDYLRRIVLADRTRSK